MRTTMSTRILELSIPTTPGHCDAEMPDARTTHPLIEREWRNKMIREAAYFRSQHRHPCPGKELEDWLEAERAVDESLRRGG
jgi:hypothetical protein